MLFTTTGELLEYSRQRVPSLRDPETGELLGPPLEPQRWAGVAVDPLSRFVAVGRLDSDEIGIYDIATGQLVEMLRSPFPRRPRRVAMVVGNVTPACTGSTSVPTVV